MSPFYPSGPPHCGVGGGSYDRGVALSFSSKICQYQP